MESRIGDPLYCVVMPTAFRNSNFSFFRVEIICADKRSRPMHFKGDENCERNGEKFINPIYNYHILKMQNRGVTRNELKMQPSMRTLRSHLVFAGVAR